MRRRILSVMAVGPIAFTLALTGCGSGSDGGSNVASVSGGNQAAATGKPSVDPQEQGLKFAQCMRENGVEVDDPEPGKGVKMKLQVKSPEDKERVDKAQEACKEFAPSGQKSGQGDPKAGENLRKLAQCMRDNGVESYPDPEGNMMRITGEVGNDPDFKDAQAKCQKESADAGMGGS
ncbi:hypothetical protein FE391_23575 [Nonomuraea sp. KC401]|uniref:hypothetical protein n=1 Tax=unclassified Nonomuraea TaxID=2593643 RepID=UPI0010FE4CCD|nr:MULTISPECIES: hypothetical protein [unclassified Nonomuraea]NBE96831.1 hypothetical protein [Nonomuraea sp. K271]TLF68029.1 hypothetical protein FE391_23575 [Nonomuraea sp. KC401]